MGNKSGSSGPEIIELWERGKRHRREGSNAKRYYRTRVRDLYIGCLTRLQQIVSRPVPKASKTL